MRQVEGLCQGSAVQMDLSVYFILASTVTAEDDVIQST